jgi:hypothetical protein
MPSAEVPAVLQPGDIVPDLSLDRVKVDGRVPADADLLNHSAVAERVTELAAGSDHPANIAIFAPWGAGKSSLFGLMEQQLDERGINHVIFDAWKHSGDRFQANFLSEVSSQLGEAQDKWARKRRAPDATSVHRKKARTPDPATALYQSRRQVQIPWMRSLPSWARVSILAVSFLLWVLLPAFLWSLHRNAWLFNDAYNMVFLHTLREWVVIALGGGLIAAVIGIIASVSQVSIEQSQPSSVKQFKDLFDRILAERAGGRKTVIFIDELDRCEPADVVATLDGLRTFLQHDDCIFVVAFDRDAVAAAIGTRGRRRADVEESPYYLTAGEYLDKVFQFQLSLPPQTRHTLRAYASRLVSTRAGIWRQLRVESPELLRAVVRLLAPAHIQSPRRMKVLLNGYAVNMRLYEGFGFPILKRAQEIAVLTVLQTEFPRFAADVEREPELLRAFAWQIQPTRPRLAEVYNAWKSDNPPDIDRLIAAENYKVRRETKSALEANLRSYLERVLDMDADLPAPDLIHVHAGDDQQKFDDSGVYSALRLARDYPRPVTLSELSGATEHDLIAAVTFLEHEIENSDLAEADSLRLLIGEMLFDASDAVVEASCNDALNAWRSRRIMPFPARSGDTAPFRGFARVFLTAADAGALEAFLDNVSDVGSGGDVIVEYAIETATSDEWQAYASLLLSRALGLLPDRPEALMKYLIREDASPTAAMLEDFPARLVSQLYQTAPVLEDLSELQPGEQRAAQQAHEAAVEQQEKEAAASTALVIQLINLDVTSGGDVHRKILRAARLAEANAPVLAGVHDDAITAVDSGLADELLLQAIAEQPSGRGRWLGALTGTAQHPEDVAAALDAILNPAITASLDERVGAASFIAKQASAADHAYDPAIEALDELITRYLDAGNAAQFDPVRITLETIDRLEADGDNRRGIHTAVYVVGSTSAVAVGPHTIATMLQRMRVEDDATIEAIVDRLMAIFETTGALSSSALLTLIGAQRQLDSRGRHIAPIPVAGILPALSTVPVVAAQWLYTRPRFVDVLRPEVFSYLPVDASSADLWGTFSIKLTETGRTRLWLALRQRRADPSVLTAVSGDTREISAEVFTRQREAVLAGRLVADKRIAFATYRTLPLDSRRAAVSALALIRALSDSAVSGEFEIAAETAHASYRRFTTSEIETIRTLLAKWSAGARSALHAELRDSLILKRLIDRRPRKRKSQ